MLERSCLVTCSWLLLSLGGLNGCAGPAVEPGPGGGPVASMPTVTQPRAAPGTASPAAPAVSPPAEPPPPEPIRVEPGPWEAGPPHPLFGAAEQQFTKQNHRAAAEGFAAFLQAAPRHPEVPRATLLRATCLLRLQQYDQALETLEQFLAASPGTLPAARARVALAKLYQELPQYGFRRGDRVFYDQELREGEEEFLGSEHQDRTVAEQETARELYRAVLAAPVPQRGLLAGDELELVRELATLDLELAHQLSASHDDLADPAPPAVKLEPPTTQERYRPDWPARKKILFLLDEATELRRAHALPDWTEARFEQAQFLMSYPEAPPAEFVQAQAEAQQACDQARRPGDAPCIRQPWEAGPELDPLRILEALAQLPASTPGADRFLVTQAVLLQQREQPRAAEERFMTFLARFPKSPYVPDVKMRLQELRAPFFQIETTPLHPSWQEVVLPVQARNLREIKFRAYEVDLEQVFRDRMTKPTPLFSEFGTAFGNQVAQVLRFKGKQAAAWQLDCKERGDRRTTELEVRLPPLPPGAYLLHATAGRLSQVALVILTDLVVVSRLQRGTLQYFVAHWRTGEPVADLPLVARELWEEEVGYRWIPRVRLHRGRTDQDGRWDLTMAPGGVGSHQAELFARLDRRYALTPAGYAPPHAGQRPATYKIFSYTDRPVYRPRDTVRFKHVVRAYQDGQNRNAAGTACQITVYNPKGETLLQRTLTTNEFGTVEGELVLEEEAPLGVYRVDAEVLGSTLGSHQSAGSRFRVEEYRKPEFEVQVTPSAEEVRPGQPVTLRIGAKYYHGAPVGGARVSYKIYRTVYVHTHHRPDRYDWLYGAGYGELFARPFEPGEEFLRAGEGVTNEQGELQVVLPTAEKPRSAGPSPPTGPPEEHDYRYSVQAEVTDLSRRTIQGAGQVMVTRAPFYLFLFPDQWFYQPGETVQLEVNGVTSGEAPVAAVGEVVLARLSYPPGQAEQIREVSRQPMQLDEAGRGFFRLPVLEAGQYRITATGRLGDGAPVQGELVLTVAATTFPQQEFRFAQAELLTDRRRYLRGEELRTLLTTPWPGATVWFSYEGGDEVLEHRVLRLAEGSQVLTRPLDDSHVPSFFVRALVVHDGQVHEVQREVFVPPGEQILDVAVTADQSEHRPGAAGGFQVRVTDVHGQPVRAEFSLAMFDASVLYIQRESAADIRPYYYGERRHHRVLVMHSGQLSEFDLYEDATPYLKLETVGLPGGWPYGLGYGYGRGWGYQRLFRDGLPLPSRQEAVPGEGEEERSFKTLEPTPDAPARPRGPGLPTTGMLAGMAPGMMPAPPPPAQVRQFFPDTALWQARVVTDSRGEASVPLTYPDSLTRWAVRAIAVDAGPRVGGGQTQVLTRKQLTARLNPPRFFTQGDQATLAAMVRNDFPDPVDVELGLTVAGEAARLVGPGATRLQLPPGGEQRFDFRAEALLPGDASFTLVARARGQSTGSTREVREEDALRRVVPVVAWGAEQLVVQRALVRDGGSQTLTFQVPAARNPAASRLTVLLEPTMGGSLLQALPYLIGYPHGCAEQTLHRFVPAAVVARTLRELGVRLEELAVPPPLPSLAEPVAVQQAPEWDPEPIRDSARLDRFVRKGINRLWSFQQGNGGFGWWPDDPVADPYMTALVLEGLLEARAAGYALDEGRIAAAADYLVRRFTKQESTYLRVRLGYVLSLLGRVKPAQLAPEFQRRGELNPYGQALLALALWQAGDRTNAAQVAENLADAAWDDPANGTTSFKPADRGAWWAWSEDRVETVAWALRAFLAIRPDDPRTDGFARWLLNNRQGNRWHSTKDTAQAIFALTRYLQLRGETRAQYEATLTVAGRPVRTLRVRPESLLTPSEPFILEGSAISTGPLELQVSMQGQGRLHVTGLLEYLTQEPRIPATGHEVFLTREVARLKPVLRTRGTWHGQVTVQEYDPMPLPEGEPVVSGELLEVTLRLEGKNDYEYLVIEDPRIAGFEPVELKSGGRYLHGTWTNLELRDRRVVFFLNQLGQGTQALSYRVRAEIPGVFRNLPARGQAMYAPRVRATSDSGTRTILAP